MASGTNPRFIYPFGHAFRAGSQLRVAIADPGANKGRWKFHILQLGPGVTHAIAHDAAHPSSLLLPVITDAAVPADLVPWPSLRSQPCRTHVPQVNAVFV
jgi:hypothetical protein